MFRLLHLADIHLDTAFSCREPAARRLLREALRKSFEKGVTVALREKLDAVLIAGDLLDSSRFSFRTERFLLEQFQRLNEAEIPLFYATGNHDPGGPSCRFRELDLPPNVHLLDEERPTVHEVQARNGTGSVTLVGAGHGSRLQKKNLACEFPPMSDSPGVGLLHAWVTSARAAESHDRYAPCSEEDLEKSGYSYWALGHVHVRQQVGSLPAWYPGNLQGRTPAESGPKGGLLVEVPKQGPASVEFLPLSSVIWSDIRLDSLEDVHTFQALEELAAEAFRARREEHPDIEDWFLRLCLEGPSGLADQLSDSDELVDAGELLAARLEVPSVALETRGLTPPVDLKGLEPGPHILAEVLELIRTARSERSLRRELAPDVLAGCGSDDDAYLMRLLSDLEAEAAWRFLERDDAH